MGDVIPIHSRRTFTKDEADSLLPVIRRITEAVASEVADLQEKLKFVPAGEPLYDRLYSSIELAMRRWAVKVSKLGCEPRGVWLVDFDAGDGWYTWRLGDEEVSFFHSHGSSESAFGAAAKGEIPT